MFQPKGSKIYALLKATLAGDDQAGPGCLFLAKQVGAVGFPRVARNLRELFEPELGADPFAVLTETFTRLFH